MNQQELLKKMIDLVYSYAAMSEEDALSLPEFVGFLNAQITPIQNPERRKDTGVKNSFTSESDDLGISLVLLSRYAKEYVKLALQDSPLKTGDEFSFLITLFTAGSHTKTELTKKMVLTKTSGTEVIKRLLRKKYIKEYDDREDKRSKRIEITSEGKGVVLELLPKITAVSKIIIGNLTPVELSTINYILKKLQIHHREIFETSPKVELNDLLDE